MLLKMATKGTRCRNQRMNRNHVHIEIFILIYLFILCKTSKMQNNQPQTCYTTCYILHLNKPNKYIFKQRKLTKNTFNHSTTIVYLLLVHDIHPNPGPNPAIVKLTCESCTQESTIHSTLSGLENGFEWICPNRNCLPNYHSKPIINYQKEIPNITSEEIYAVKVFAKPKPPIHPNKEKIDECRTLAQQENKMYLGELPKISPADYMGKELCRGCGKTVKENHRALTCDTCLRWIHLPCSDLSLKAYNKYKTQKEFAWICNLCRSPELLPINEKFNQQQCKTEDLPKTYKFLKTRIKNDEEIILHLNARSIANKADEVKEICSDINPALLLLTETWLDESNPKGTAVPEGYKIIRKDRSETFKQIYGKSNGGGIAILYRKDINIKVHGTLNSDKNELLWCTIWLKGKQYLICLIYRAEYTSLLEATETGESEIENLLQATMDYNLLMIGDTNCDVQNENPSKSTKTLISITEEYGLKQLINQPTRFNKNSATTIDHIFTRDEQLVKEAGTCEGISDHCGIYCIVKADKNSQKETIRCRSFKEFNEINFQKDITEAIAQSSYHHHMQNEDLNKAFDAWISVIKNISDIHAPWKEFTRNNNKKHNPWYTQELEEIKDQKNRSLQLYRLYRNPDDLEVYKRAKNLQTHLTRSLKRAYYKEKINNFEGNSRKIWQILKEVTNKNYRDEVLPDNPNKKTANKFNTFFAKVGKQVQEKLNIKIDMPNLDKIGQFKFSNETENKIDSLIKRIRPDVATGCDEISSRLLQAARPAIITDLKDMVNLSYKTEIFPEALKKAHVKALHKEGDNNNPAQYRPISILPTISKIFERSASDQLAEFLIKNRKLSSKQHAYKKSYSTVTCLFEFIESIQNHMDKKDLVAVASLDLSKAFDSLSHALILDKLIQKDVDKTVAKWIKSYLENRKQCVKFDKVLSDEEQVESGVPQGSILGPLLFITCTDDLSIQLDQFETYSYADDTQILVTGKTIEDIQRKLVEAIQTANAYYNKNSLLNNIGKTKIMLFQPQGSSHNEQILEITPKDIPQLEKPIYAQDHLKILGIYVDKNLNWNKHISYVKKKATNAIRNLHRANQILPLKEKRLLYNSLVVPHFTYADIIWNCCGKLNCKKIQQAQNFAAKSILGLRKRSSSTEALKRLELLPLEEKRNIHAAVYVKKALEGIGSTETINKYNKLKGPADLRPGTLQIPKHRTAQYEKSPFYFSIKVWNSTPNHIKNSKVETFKNNLQKHKVENFIKS